VSYLHEWAATAAFGRGAAEGWKCKHNQNWDGRLSGFERLPRCNFYTEKKSEKNTTAATIDKRRSHAIDVSDSNDSSARNKNNNLKKKIRNFP
jgi:antirestriction protein